MPSLKNKKHEQFAHLVANGTKPVKAYVSVGYSENGADQSSSKLLKKAEISARIAEISDNIARLSMEKIAISKVWVIDQLVENVKMAKAAVPVLDNKGNPIGEYKQELGAANRALELLGKELAMFVDRKEVRTGALDELTDEQLAGYVARKAKEAGITLQ